jgi:hypothetical protein
VTIRVGFCFEAGAACRAAADDQRG